MALDQAGLASDLEALVPTDDATQAANDLADILIGYLGGASVSGVAANAGLLAGAPRSALFAAMSPGLNAPNGAATAIASGYQAAWTAMGPIAPTLWVIPPPNVIVPASLVPPAGLASLATTLQAAFDANVAAGLSLSDACSSIAAAIHAASLGGLVTIQPPLPAAPVVTPIL